MKNIVCLCAGLAALALAAGEWKGLSDENWVAGAKLKPTDLRRKVVVVAEWGANCADCAEDLAFVQKNALGQRASGHPVVFLAVHRQGGSAASVKTAAESLGLKGAVYQEAAFTEAPEGGKLPFYYVVDGMGKVSYSGSEKNDVAVALVEAIMNLPVPGQLIDPALSLRKLKSLPKQLKMGRNVEGSALAPVKALLKSKKPAEVEEAQAVLDSIEKAKKNLESEIADDLAANDKGAALRDIRWFCTTWPSEKAKYADDFKRLAADPEAVQAEKAFFAAQRGKKRR